MAKPLRPKRGTTAKNDAFTGLASEITIDTDKHSIRVHDGVTAGGHEILPKAKNDELYAPKGLDVGVTSVNGNKGALTPEQTGCLPAGGGTLEGKVEIKGRGEFRNFDDSHDMAILGGNNWENGAFVQVTGQNHSGGGWFQFAARANGMSAFFQGKPDGGLVWMGVEIERVVESGVGYVRYHSGLQICYGKGGTNDVGGCYIGFPVPFADIPEVLPVIHGSMGSGGNWCMLYEPIDGNAGNVWAFLPNGGHAQVGFSWVAVGRWK